MKSDIIDSERTAMTRGSVIDRYFTNEHHKSYVPKKEWDDFDLNYKFNDTDTQLFYDPEYEIQNSPLIPLNNDTTLYTIEENGPYVVSDLVMKLRRSEIGDDCNVVNLFNMAYIVCDIFTRPNSNEKKYYSHDISRISFIANLFLAKLINKEIKEYDDIIEIPIVIFDVNKSFKNRNCNFGNKFPVCLIKDCVIRISIVCEFTVPINISFSYRRYNVKSDLDYEKLDYYCICIKTDESLIIPNNDTNGRLMGTKCKILLFSCFNEYDPLEFDIIEQIRLYLDGKEPIVWNDRDGDIIKMKIEDRYVYAVSLCPQIRSKKSMIKLLKGDDDGHGVNFNRMLRTIIHVETYAKNDARCIFKVTAVSINVSVFRSRTMGTVD